MARITSFITGAAFGAAAALLFAPKTGEQTRALVTEKANAVVGEAKDFSSAIPGSAQDIFSSVTERGSELVKNAANKGQEFASDATSKVKGVATQASAPAPSQPDEELRQKIEAARQRIAAQVAENAEANKAVEVEPAVTEAPEAAQD